MAHLRKEVSRREYSSWVTVLSQDSKALWNKINWKGNISTTDDSKKPDLQDLASHFSEKGQTGRDETVLNEVQGSTYVECLDKDISTDEISSGMKNLKEDKSSGDGWVKKMLTNLPMSLLMILQVIYNCILKFHIFPTAWRTTIVNEIFKHKGSPTAEKNYRGISLVQLLAKLFDFILLDRFNKWFVPADEQTAYQSERGSPDHVFLLRCMAQYAKRYKKTIFFIAIDFDGAFDRVSRSLLVRKLCLFGAGVTFTACIASIYMSTDNMMFRGTEHTTYKLYSGIKQGLPLSPLLFLFYINDIFDYFGAIYNNGKNVFQCLHLLVHADDATIIAHDRNGAVQKLRSLLQYCALNFIIPQYCKCEFIVINGTAEDRKPLPFGDSFLPHVLHITLLGSHLTCTASLNEEMSLHMQKRYKSVIKFYNFIRSNKSAPLKVKLKVLRSCVLGSLLHNCETFGDNVPKDLQPSYVKMLKSCFNVRVNTPNELLFIESGFIPIKAVMYCRQLKFYQRFRDSLQPKSRRDIVFRFLLENETSYLKHYVRLSSKYTSTKDIVSECRDEIKTKIYKKANESRYKFNMYVSINPDLQISPFLDIYHPNTMDIIKFRLGTHFLPIETGRWNRTPRHERLCTTCGVLGDEKHVLYSCSLISREDLILDNFIHKIWYQPEVFKLFERIKAINCL